MLAMLDVLVLEWFDADRVCCVQKQGSSSSQRKVRDAS